MYLNKKKIIQFSKNDFYSKKSKKKFLFVSKYIKINFFYFEKYYFFSFDWKMNKKEQIYNI